MSSRQQVEAGQVAALARAEIEEQQEQEFAYDSMSTILEVDSEDSSGLAEETSNIQRESARFRARNEGGRVSPLGRTLSGLSEQVERLRRRSAELATGNQQSRGQSQTVQVETETQSQSETEAPEHQKPAITITGETGSTQSISQQVQQQGGKSSAEEMEEESLMTSSFTPSSSPKSLRFRAGTRANEQVETSDKTTITAIDLKLMDQLVSRFFVSTRDQASQFVQFDCPAPSENEQLEAGRSPAGVMRRSVAVGTEKFSRERFSLLPPTLTKGTQTRSSSGMMDLGASETRRFKLSHLRFQPIRRLSSGNQYSTSQQEEEQETERDTRSPETGQISSAASPDEAGKEGELQQTDSLSASSSHAGSRELLAQTSDSYEHEESKQTKNDAKLMPSKSSLSRKNSGKGERAEIADCSTQTGKEVKSAPAKLEATDPKRSASKMRRRSGNREQVSPQTNLEDDDATGFPQEVEKKGKRQDELESDSTEVEEDNPDKGAPDDTSKLSERDSLNSASSTPIVADSPEEAEKRSEEKFERSTKKRRDYSPDKGMNASPGEEAREKGSSSKIVETTSAKTMSEVGNSAARVPSVKTEVRVVIEIKDSKGRSISELRTDSELAPDRVRRLSELKTSRHVAASSPSQVLEKLRNAGRVHSIVQPTLGQHSAPLGWGSSPSLLLSSAVPTPASMPSGPSPLDSSGKWRQVSSSSIENEIETRLGNSRRRRNRASEDDTSTRPPLDAPNQAASLILLSTEANVSHGQGDRLELNQHASRSTRSVERRLVEGGARLEGDRASWSDSRRSPQASAPAVGSTQPLTPPSPASLPEGRSSTELSQRERAKPAPISPKPALASPRSPSLAQQRRSQQREQASATPTRKSTRFELAEERDERKQVSRNGRLIYDDRLRERRFESEKGEAGLGVGTDEGLGSRAESFNFVDDDADDEPPERGRQRKGHDGKQGAELDDSCAVVGTAAVPLPVAFREQPDPPPPEFTSSTRRSRRADGNPGSMELSTRLTRRKRPSGSRAQTVEKSDSATHTQLEQTVRQLDPVPEVAPGKQQASATTVPTTGSSGRPRLIQTRVAFESDTDSMAERSGSAQSAPNSRNGARRTKLAKELLSETRFTRASLAADPEQADPALPGPPEGGKPKRVHEKPNQQLWDYSLNVNRVRGRQVDSKVR